MNAVVRSFGARALSFVPTALATLLASRLIIENYGLLAFNSFALILSLINLVPLNNLGVGAAITSALAEGGVGSSRAERTVLTAARVLAVSSVVTAITAMIIAAFGWWEPLLGQSSGPDLWVGISLVIYALTFLPGLGQSMLLGVHRNHTTILIQTFFNPLNALVVAVIVLAGAGDSVIVLVPCISLLLVNLVTSAVAGRATRISWRRIARRLPRRKRYPGTSIRSMSGPVLILTLSTPIALQSDRIVLSHVSTTDAVAQYSVALQIFGPALVLVAATAQPLWPIWAQARMAGKRGPGVLRVVSLFSVAGLAVGLALALLSGPVARLVAGSQVQISPMLAFAGALGVLTAAMSQPVAMSLMYPSGLRIIVWCTLIALPLNIGLSIVLGRHLGAPGPLFASCIVGILVQALPGLVVSYNRQRAGRHSQFALATPGTTPGTASGGAPAVTPADRPTPARRRAAVVPYRAFDLTPAPDTTPAVTEPATRRRPTPAGRAPAPAGHEVLTAEDASSAGEAAIAMVAAVSGAAGIGGGTDTYADDTVAAVAGKAPGAPGRPTALQPVAPFRRPRDNRPPPADR